MRRPDYHGSHLAASQRSAHCAYRIFSSTSLRSGDHRRYPARRSIRVADQVVSSVAVIEVTVDAGEDLPIRTNRWIRLVRRWTKQRVTAQGQHASCRDRAATLAQQAFSYKSITWRSQRTPVVFIHGWPRAEDQMFFLASRGYRCIAHDRRGHGRSSQPWNGNDLDTYADDLARARRETRPEERNPCRPFDRWRRSHPLHRSPRHQARGQGRADRRIPPLDAQDPNNPGGLPIEVFDELRANVSPTARSS